MKIKIYVNEYLLQFGWLWGGGHIIEREWFENKNFFFRMERVAFYRVPKWKDVIFL